MKQKPLFGSYRILMLILSMCVDSFCIAMTIPGTLLSN
jgi:hypothetical protein